MGMKIGSSYTEATSRYGAHMGTCYHYPAMARAWVRNQYGEVSAEIEITAEQYPNLEPHQLQAKAVAMLRTQIHH